MTDESSVLREIKAVRAKIKRIEKTRRELYDEQNRLVVLGDTLGFKAVDMARMDPGASKALAESFGQIIRKAKKRP